MRCYSHLSDDEREQIGLAKALGHSIGAIAQAIGRSKSTVWRELCRNRLPSGRYSPLHAAGPYQLRRRCEAIDRPHGRVQGQCWCMVGRGACSADGGAGWGSAAVRTANAGRTSGPRLRLKMRNLVVGRSHSRTVVGNCVMVSASSTESAQGHQETRRPRKPRGRFTSVTGPRGGRR